MGILELALDVGGALLKVVMAGLQASQEERELLYAHVEEILREGLDACVSARAEHAMETEATERAFDEQRKKLEEPAPLPATPDEKVATATDEFTSEEEKTPVTSAKPE